MLRIITTSNRSDLLERLFQPILQGSGIEHSFQLIDKEGSGEWDANPGDTVLLMGNALLDQLKNAGYVKKSKNVTLNSLREKVHSFGEFHCLFTFDPMMIEMESGSEYDITWDIRLACRHVVSGALKPIIGKYRYVDDFSDAINCIRAQHAATGKAVYASVDTETVGYDPHAVGARFVSIQITVKDGETDVFYTSDGVIPVKVQAQLRAILTSDKVKVTGASFKYDKLWFWHLLGIEVTNHVFDTYLVGSLLDENRSNSLKNHVKHHCEYLGGYEDELENKYDKGRMDLVPKDELITYAGGDTDGCLKVTQCMRTQLLSDQRLTRFYVDLLHPAERVFTKMEHRGIVVDLEKYKELRAEAEAEQQKLQAEALSHIPVRIKLKYGLDKEENPLGKKNMLKEFLFTQRGLNLTPLAFTESGEKLMKKEKRELTADEKIEYASLAAKDLEWFNDHPEAKPFIDAYVGNGKVSKILGTYIDGFTKHLRTDGKFHPTYLLGAGGEFGDDDGGGTVTGRSSCKGPAYQTIPKRGKWAKKLRTVYIVPPGYVILKFDFSQGELKIIADIASEPTMLDVYQNGKDIHTTTAASVNGMTYEALLALPEEEIELKRYGAKALNFGFVYGLMAPGFQDYAWVSYGLKYSLEQAEGFRDSFFDLYSELPTWHKAAKDFAGKHGYIRNPFGRIRHLPLIKSKNWSIKSRQERQAINSHIQSGLADLMFLAMVEIDRRWPDLWIWGNTHDSLEMYVKEDQALDIAKEMKALVENLNTAHFGWKPKVKMTVDFEMGTTNLAELKKLKIAA